MENDALIGAYIKRAEIVVKIFVEFKDAKGAKSCKEKLHGRYFGGKIISAEIYDQDLYDHNDFSG